MADAITRYWERRYANGRNSGEGSTGNNAKFKAREVINVMTSERARSIIDWGCGDGKVAARIAARSKKYVGVDISSTVINRLRRKHPKHQFYLHDAHGTRCDLALSLDVLFHILDDDRYYKYLDNLFGSAKRLVLIHSTNRDEYVNEHVRHRLITADIESRQPKWALVKSWQGINTCQFFLYKRSRKE